jgi:hypothetical protein
MKSKNIFADLQFTLLCVFSGKTKKIKKITMIFIIFLSGLQCELLGDGIHVCIYGIALRRTFLSRGECKVSGKK